MKTPAVRILMPAYNAERFIAAAVDSIVRQTFQDWELVVVDDGSSDHTAERAEAARDDRVSVIRQANSGPEAARQRAFRGCVASFVARMDADDVMEPDRLRMQVDYLRTHREVGVLGGQIEFLSEDGLRSGFASSWPVGHEQISRRFLALKGGFCNSAMTCRRELQARVQSVPCIGPGADVEVVLRLVTMTRLANLPEVVTYVRIHRHSLQSSFDQMKILQRARFGLACARANQAGREPPSWDDFIRSWPSRCIWDRVGDRRTILVRKAARQAQWHALNGRMFPRGHLMMALAGMLAPLRASKRIGRTRVKEAAGRNGTNKAKAGDGCGSAGR